MQYGGEPPLRRAGSHCSTGTAAALLLSQPLVSGRLGCGARERPWLIMLTCYLRTLALQFINGLAAPPAQSTQPLSRLASPQPPIALTAP